MMMRDFLPQAQPPSLYRASLVIQMLSALVIIMVTSGVAYSAEALTYLEADPLAFINRGYSVHPGYENWGLRLDLTIVQVDFPQSYEERFYNTTRFDLVTDIQGFKIDYVGETSDGPFVGLDAHHQALHFRHRKTHESEDLHALFIGPRAGWKFVLWEGLYVTPWAAAWRNILAEQSFSVGSDRVTTNPWDLLITLHIGYHFPLKD